MAPVAPVTAEDGAADGATGDGEEGDAEPMMEPEKVRGFMTQEWPNLRGA